MVFPENSSIARTYLRKCISNTNSIPLVESDIWYIVSSSWIEDWKQYVDFDQLDSSKVLYDFFFTKCYSKIYIYFSIVFSLFFILTTR